MIFVRNFFSVLKDILVSKDNFRYRVGFGTHFPTPTRRVFEAKKEKKAVIRRTIEHKIRRRIGKRSLSAGAIFSVTMSQEFKKRFYADLNISVFALPDRASPLTFIRHLRMNPIRSGNLFTPEQSTTCGRLT